MDQQDREVAAAIADAEARLDRVAATAELRRGGFDRDAGAVVGGFGALGRPSFFCMAAMVVGAIGSTIFRPWPNTSLSCSGHGRPGRQ